jgi:hypothetical protein
MKNNALKNDVRELSINKKNISKMSTGIVGDKFSIEVNELEPKSYSSYLYNNKEDRDADLVELNKILN